MSTSSGSKEEKLTDRLFKVAKVAKKPTTGIEKFLSDITQKVPGREVKVIPSNSGGTCKLVIGSYKKVIKMKLTRRQKRLLGVEI